MKFHDFPGPGPKFHDFPGLESKLSNSMTFQVFQDRYEPCFITEIKSCSLDIALFVASRFDHRVVPSAIRGMDAMARQTYRNCSVLSFGQSRPFCDVGHPYVGHPCCSWYTTVWSRSSLPVEHREECLDGLRIAKVCMHTFKYFQPLANLI